MIYTPTCVYSNRGIVIAQNTASPVSVFGSTPDLHPRSTGFVAKMTANGTWSTKSAPIGQFAFVYNTDFIAAGLTALIGSINDPFPAGSSGDWTFIGTSSLMTYAGSTYIIGVCKMLWSLGSSSPYDVISTTTSSYLSSAVTRTSTDYVSITSNITWETADTSNSIYVYNATLEISGFD